MINDKADEDIEEMFEPLLSRYQIGLETSMKGREFVFDCVHQLYFKCHKINPNRGRSYINSPNQMKNEKAAINKKDNRYFQYAVTVA